LTLKNTLICPNCEGRKIWRIERLLLQKGTIPVLGAYSATMAFEVYICKKCGLTEMYADGISGLQPDPAAGIHLIDNEPNAGLR
jgi:predicted nucleic-acid-binding Zn-ribbon protein